MEAGDRCGAKTKQGKGTCRKPAGWGTGHPGSGTCRLHAGNTPGANKRAAVVAMQNLAHPIDVEPHEALIHCVQLSAGEVHYCSLQIQALEESELTVTEVATKEGVERGEPTSTTEESNAASLNIWIRARHDAMDRLARYSKMAMDAGVDERRVALAEGMAALIAPVIGRILEGLGLSAAQQKKAPALVRGSLAALEGTATEMENAA